ncbi:hypothetical protein [Saccharicrinis aurantiacus]|uniref:hypothetical protein n=1 Tax=Saccharicrinis aurantiacus TaxID=1849719 RepID=UPI002492C957|nr:hypothetical protein [Saccharicrinis aurantiacus]
MKHFILVVCILITIGVNAQQKTYRKQVQQASNLVATENYSEAMAIYEGLLSAYPDDIYLELKAGECFLFAEAKIPLAIELLESAAGYYLSIDSTDEQSLIASYYLAQCYHLGESFNKSIDEYKSLLSRISEKELEAISKINRGISYCNNAIELTKDTLYFKITNMGSNINTALDEHSPVISYDENLLLFTSRKSDSLGINDDERIYSTVWRDRKWKKPEHIYLNDKSNTATVSLASDGKTLVLYRSNGGVGDLYYSNYKNRKWQEPIKFPAPINSLYAETHAAFSFNGDTIYYTSDRPGGFGGMDIYMSIKLPDGNWGKAINLGPRINTAYDESSPFIDDTNHTLYFSSEGHNSMGGYDIFKAHSDDDNKWVSVENIGYPINTPYDDLFYCPTADEHRVYYASKRKEGFGGSDIYLIEYPDKHTNSLTTVGGFIYTDKKKPAEQANIILVDNSDEEKEEPYRVNPNTGKYVLILPANKDYTMYVECDGFKPVEKQVIVPGGKAFKSKGFTFYIDPIVLEPIGK